MKNWNKTIDVMCPNCNTILSASESEIGTESKCPSCGHSFLVKSNHSGIFAKTGSVIVSWFVKRPSDAIHAVAGKTFRWIAFAMYNPVVAASAIIAIGAVVVSLVCSMLPRYSDCGKDSRLIFDKWTGSKILTDVKRR